MHVLKMFYGTLRLKNNLTTKSFRMINLEKIRRIPYVLKHLFSVSNINTDTNTYRQAVLKIKQWVFSMLPGIAVGRIMSMQEAIEANMCQQ